MDKRLHKFTCAIVIKQGGRTAVGSGMLISKNLVLTCAHNFFLQSNRVDDASMKIYPGAYGELKSPKTVDKVYIAEAYRPRTLN